MAVPQPSSAGETLFGSLIDHAPLFPPASLPLEEALDDVARALASPEAWMWRLFVCPASRLPELGDSRLDVSVVVDLPVEEVQLPADAKAVEGRGDPRLLRELGRSETFVEVPLDDRLEAAVAEVRAAGADAKVRCGPEAPPIEALAEFVRLCRAARVKFKATAGLHHAVRTDGQHGFVNLLAAAIFGDEEGALGEDDPAAFGLGREAFSWRDHQAGIGEIARVRRDLFRAIGSCSFFEPVEELRTLGFV
jgi:hypothetical protein